MVSSGPGLWGVLGRSSGTFKKKVKHSLSPTAEVEVGGVDVIDVRLFGKAVVLIVIEVADGLGRRR